MSAFPQFSLLQRLFHWVMAAMILAMLFIGIGMVSTVAPRYWSLVSLHRPLGIMILALVPLRILLRLRKGAPPLPSDLPAIQQFAAKASHLLLYVLMLLTPLVGWAMLSAGGYPIVMVGSFHLPPIAPHDDGLHTLFHVAHIGLALLFFATILLHLAAALFHALVRHDGVFSSMVPWRPAAPKSDAGPAD
jgi:cytochrome b561